MNKNRILFALSFIICVLVLFISVTGISDSLYILESASWRLQCYGQDFVDLIVVTPCLMLSAFLMLNGHLVGRLTWPGIMLYLIYTFFIYCFDVHFNSFFIEYCLVLGLSVYSLGYFLYSHRNAENTNFQPSNKWIKAIAIYLFLTGGLFYFLWLSEIVPAIRTHSVPKSLTEMNLATNPVHVLDLSFLLPLFIITSILLFRKQRLGLKLAAALLLFSTLMHITILVLNILQEDNLIMKLVFSGLSFVSLVLLVILIKNYKTWNENKHEVLWKGLKYN